MHIMWQLQPPVSYYPEWIRIGNTGLVFSVRASGVLHLPANQSEPGEAVIKWVTSSHHIFTVLSGIVGHIGSAVIHVSHEIEPLPARSSDNYHMMSFMELSTALS